MNQLVLKNGKIVGIHEMHQDVRGIYPDCDIITYDKPLPVNEYGIPLDDDPRTEAEKKEAYKDQRRAAYPTIGEQLDMLYRDTVNGTTVWRDEITNIKEQFPKPTQNKEPHYG